MSEPRTRLDQAMNARSLELKKRWVHIAKEADITTSALSGIRRGEYKPSAHTARALEDALHWAHGSIEQILAGGEPTPLEDIPPPAERRSERIVPSDEELAQMNRAELMAVVRQAQASIEAAMRELERIMTSDNDKQ